MRFEAPSSPTTPTSFVKRRRFMSSDPMESEAAKVRLAAISEKLGREIRVFKTSARSSASEKLTNEDPPDDFYELTPEDYFRVMSLSKKEDKSLKTRKIREAEQAARRSRATKATIRVRFPDDYTLEAKFHSSETFQSLIDLLMKAIARPDLPFYIYTTPPKQQVKDMSQDFYSAKFVPGAIVYFSYDLPQGDELAAANSGPFLLDEIQSLNGFDTMPEPSEPVQSAMEPAPVGSSVNVQEPKSAEKKPSVPKWFKR